MPERQGGFTLVEIAVVLVIVGLLLGGILKGRELINSARVRSLADTSSTIQAAYFGFIDRYRRVPGDWNASDATTAIGVTINTGGNDNGRLDSPAGDYTENNALWEQLSKAGFLQGSYRGGSAAPTPAGDVSPLNAFHQVIVIGRTSDYLGDNPVRLNLVMGRGVPVGIMRELDSKLDDGVPDTGAVRGVPANATVFTAPGPDAAHGAMEADCVSGTPLVWDLPAGARDCNGVYLF